MTSAPAPRPALDPDRIVAPAGWRVEVTEATPSTNAVVAERARAGEDEGLVVVTEHQTAGPRPARPGVGDAGARVADLLGAAAPRPARRRTGPWLPLLTGYAVQAARRRPDPRDRAQVAQRRAGRGAQAGRDPGRADRDPDRSGRRGRGGHQRLPDPRRAPGRPGHLDRARDLRARRPHRPARPGAGLPARPPGPARRHRRRCARRTPTSAPPSGARSTSTCPAARTVWRYAAARRSTSTAGARWWSAPRTGRSPSVPAMSFTCAPASDMIGTWPSRPSSSTTASTSSCPRARTPRR